MNIEEFFRDYYPRLLRLAVYWCRDPDVAADLVQLTFEEALKQPYDASRGKGVYGYLVMILRTMYLRSTQADSSLHSGLGESVAFDELDLHADYNPWPVVTWQIHIREKLERMLPLYRSVALHMIAGHTGDEISTLLKLNTRSTYRAMERVREDLLDY